LLLINEKVILDIVTAGAVFHSMKISSSSFSGFVFFFGMRSRTVNLRKGWSYGG